MLAAAGSRLLVDVTRDFREQAGALDRAIDAVLLTHGHRDACGGLAELRRWLRERSSGPVPVYASKQTIDVVSRRYSRLDHCAFSAVRDHERVRIGPFSVTALTVPHAREHYIPTFAWKLTVRGTTVVYASDVAELTPRLRRFARGADALIIDGARWGRQLFSHLTIDRELPALCEWRVKRILLTQIGRTLPAHSELQAEVRRLCRKAAPAYDGLDVDV
jgi:phosphoribosyl 1,2-cyclic phosphodiesterase